ncbi:MAG: hypothetical protein IIC66_00405 [candidate division Zixibacteria bacterium]|nr:hypothetical protein [candidate division Zixibacteria bacterium]
MSKVVRITQEAPVVYIGEQRLDLEKDAESVTILTQVFPEVRVETAADGIKLIPAREIIKINQVLTHEKELSEKLGREQGYQQGLKEGLAEAEKVLKDFESAISDAINERQRLFEDAKTNILSLVMQISRKVTFDAVSIDPDATLHIISKVVDSLVDKSFIKIKVNPDHLPIVEQNIDKFLKNNSTIKEIKIEPDSRVDFGGCLIETPTGDIDARIDSQLNSIEQTLISEE